MECTKRAAELHDDALFKQPPSRDECPICFLELPIRNEKRMYQTCCGKTICNGCVLASSEQSVECLLCPFCRKPAVRTNEEGRKRIEMRVELNDPNAIFMLGFNYFKGDGGFEQDIGKALELLHRAAELRSIDAHYYLGSIYATGDGVQVDEKKGKHHLEIATIRGHVDARYSLGLMEGKTGNRHRAMKHLMISANAGHTDSLKGVQHGYSCGGVTKDDFEKTLRAHKKSKDEIKSEWRDKADENKGDFE